MGEWHVTRAPQGTEEGHRSAEDRGERRGAGLSPSEAVGSLEEETRDGMGEALWSGREQRGRVRRSRRAHVWRFWEVIGGEQNRVIFGQ